MAITRAKGKAAVRAAVVLALLTPLSGGCALDRGLPDAPADARGLNDPKALDEMVERLVSQGAYETALAFAVKAAGRAPAEVERWVRVHELAELLGRDELAAEALSRIAALEPAHPLLAVAEAARQLKAGKPAAAEAALEHVPQDRRPAGYYRVAGLIAEWKGDGLAARAHYASGLGRFPDDPGLTVNLALAYALAGDLAAANDLLLSLMDRGGALRAIGLRNLVLAAFLAGDEELARRLALEAGIDGGTLAFFRAVAGLQGPERARALITGRLPVKDGAHPAKPARPHG